MAALQLRGDSYRLIFQYLGQQHSCTLGDIAEGEAHQWKARCEQLLMRVKQGLLEVPRGVAVADFILSDGKPPVDPAIAMKKLTTLQELKRGFLDTHGNGAIEINTLATARIHLTHIEGTLGKKFLLSGITLGKLQEHIERRQTAVLPITIKKELDTFRTAWNWGQRMKWVDQPFPANGLVYPKCDEKLPFMTWAEIKRRIRAGADADSLWACLYLDTEEVTALLAYVKAQKAPDWMFPMLATAAYTGARRSELIRALQEDIDIRGNVVTIREKKRARGSRTTRRVPICSPLAKTLKEWLDRRRGCRNLFGPGDEPLAVQTVHSALRRLLDDSKWSVVKGSLRSARCGAHGRADYSPRRVGEERLTRLTGRASGPAPYFERNQTMTKPKIDLHALTQEAEDAFWQVVGQHYPEATSGDLSPWTSMRLSQVAEEAIAEWIWANVPQPRDPSP